MINQIREILSTPAITAIVGTFTDSLGATLPNIFTYECPEQMEPDNYIVIHLISNIEGSRFVHRNPVYQVSCITADKGLGEVLADTVSSTLNGYSGVVDGTEIPLIRHENTVYLRNDDGTAQHSVDVTVIRML